MRKEAHLEGLPRSKGYDFNFEIMIVIDVNEYDVFFWESSLGLFCLIIFCKDCSFEIMIRGQVRGSCATYCCCIKDTKITKFHYVHLLK
jgi:hypothetical protein